MLIRFMQSQTHGALPGYNIRSSPHLPFRKPEVWGGHRVSKLNSKVPWRQSLILLDSNPCRIASRNGSSTSQNLSFADAPSICTLLCWPHKGSQRRQHGTRKFCSLFDFAQSPRQSAIMWPYCSPTSPLQFSGHGVDDSPGPQYKCRACDCRFFYYFQVRDHWDSFDDIAHQRNWKAGYAEILEQENDDSDV